VCSVQVRALPQLTSWSRDVAIGAHAASRVIKLERQQDMLVSKLHDYVATLGGKVEIRAKFPDYDVVVRHSMSLPRSCRPKTTGQFLPPESLAPRKKRLKDQVGEQRSEQTSGACCPASVGTRTCHGL
jgi:hypothetical protein